MKKIKIRFTDFWSDQNTPDSTFFRLLSNHFNIEISENPDYIIYSVFGYEYLKYNCIRIFFTGEQVCPDFDISDYAIGFESLTFGDRYLRFPLYALGKLPEDFLEIEKDYKEIDINRFNNRDFAVFTYSNSKATSPRDDFFLRLNIRKKVVSPGKHLNNTGFYVDDKVSFESNFKFSIAFENASYLGYTTEKIIDSFAAKTIPIYYGDESVENDFHPESFINLHNFDTFDDAIDYIISLENDPNRLSEILHHKKFKSNVYLYHQQLLDFFVNIFQQDLISAKRRPNSNRVQEKNRKLKFIAYVYRFKHSKIYRLFVGIAKKIFNFKNFIILKFRGWYFATFYGYVHI